MAVTALKIKENYSYLLKAMMALISLSTEPVTRMR